MCDLEAVSDRELELILFRQCIELLQELPNSVSLEDARTELLKIRDFYTRVPKKTLSEPITSKVTARIKGE